MEVSILAQIDVLKIRLQEPVTEIKNIVNLGRLSLTNPSHFDLFKNLYCHLRPHFYSFMSIWDELLELVIINDCRFFFPNDSDKELRKSLRCIYQEGLAIHKHFMNPNSSGLFSSSASKPLSSSYKVPLYENSSPQIISSSAKTKNHSSDFASPVNSFSNSSTEVMNVRVAAVPEKLFRSEHPAVPAPDNPVISLKNTNCDDNSKLLRASKGSSVSNHNFAQLLEQFNLNSDCPAASDSNNSNNLLLDFIPNQNNLSFDHLAVRELHTSSMGSSVCGQPDPIRLLKSNTTKSDRSSASEPHNTNNLLLDYIPSINFLSSERPAAPILYSKPNDISLVATAAPGLASPHLPMHLAAPIQHSKTTGISLKATVALDDLQVQSASRTFHINRLSLNLFHETQFPKRPAEPETPKPSDFSLGKLFAFDSFQLICTSKRASGSHNFKCDWPHWSHVPKSKHLAVPHSNKTNDNLSSIAFLHSRTKLKPAFRSSSGSYNLISNWLHQPNNIEIHLPTASYLPASSSLEKKFYAQRKTRFYTCRVFSVNYRLPPVRYITTQEALQLMEEALYFIWVGGAYLIIWMYPPDGLMFLPGRN